MILAHLNGLLSINNRDSINKDGEDLTKLSETPEQTRTEDELRHDTIYFVSACGEHSNLLPGAESVLQSSQV